MQRSAQRPSSSPGCGHAHTVRPQPVTLTAQQHEEMSKLSSTQRIKPIPEGFEGDLPGTSSQHSKGAMTETLYAWRDRRSTPHTRYAVRK